jgi:hypothetical protein
VARAAGIFFQLHRNAQLGSGLLFRGRPISARHDYDVNIAGGFAAAQRTSNYVLAGGIHLPTKRRLPTSAAPTAARFSKWKWSASISPTRPTRRSAAAKVARGQTLRTPVATGWRDRSGAHGQLRIAAVSVASTAAVIAATVASGC